MPNLVLATGRITNADELTIELAKPADAPATILIKSPDQPTVSPPSRFDPTAAAMMRVLAAARVTLAQIKANER